MISIILTIFQLFLWLSAILLFYFIKSIKHVPKDTVYIIDKHTHYHKTVKNGYFFLNPVHHTITTKISIHPLTNNYYEIFETEDGKYLPINFSVTYSAKNLEDVLYNLEKVRRSIDDILKSCMYYAMLSLKSTYISRQLLIDTFKSNLESQAMSFGLVIHNFNIMPSNSAFRFNHPKPFKPHKNYSDSVDPIQFI